MGRQRWIYCLILLLSVIAEAGVDAGSGKGTNFATPTVGTDAANKQYVDDNISGPGGVHKFMSAAHGDTTNSTPPARGSVIVGNATPEWDELIASAALGATATDFLGTDGTDVGYRTLAQVLADLSGDAGAAFDWNAQNLTNVGTIASGKHTIAGGGVGLDLDGEAVGTSSILLRASNDAEAVIIQTTVDVTRIFYQDDHAFHLKTSPVASLIAETPGVGDVLRWTCAADGTVTMTNGLIIPDADWIGSVSDPTAIQIEADGDVVIDEDLFVDLNLTACGNTNLGDEATDDHAIWGVTTIGDDGSTNHVDISATGDFNFKGASGLVFGSFFGNDIAFVTAGGTGSYTIISDADIAVSQTNNTTFQNNQELDIGTFAGKYLVTWSMSVKGTGANKHLVGAIGVDVGGVTGDVAQGPGRNHAVTLGSAEMTLSGSTHLDLSANDEVSIMVTNETDNTNITIEHINLTITQVGGT